MGSIMKFVLIALGSLAFVVAPLRVLPWEEAAPLAGSSAVLGGMFLLAAGKWGGR